MAITSVLFAAAVAASSLGGLEIPAHQQGPLNLSASESSPLELAQRQPDRSGILTTRISGSWVNVRREPTLRSQVEGEGRDGDTVTILRESAAVGDRYPWYFVELSRGRVRGWVRGDLIAEAQSQIPNTRLIEASTALEQMPSNPAPAARDRAAAVPTPATGGSFPTVSVPRQSPHARRASPPWHTASRTASPEPSSNTALPPRTARRSASEAPRSEVNTPAAFSAVREYTAEDVSYFTEIALGSEFGNASRRIRKWDDAINIRVHGTPTRADQIALANVVQELDDILSQSTGGRVSVNVLRAGDSQQPNIDMYFVPHGEFSRYEPNYRPGNLGFAYVNWRQDEIYKARILVTSTADISQLERSHLIREELTQSLGLLQDSLRYADSIFYQGWTSTTAYSSRDEAVIRMLYDPAIEPGMDGRQAEAALSNAARLVAGDSAGRR